MSEIDLIRKLEKLNTEKPNKEWSSFTRESILSSKVEIKESQGFGFWFDKIRSSSFAPLTACVFLAVIFGMFINITPNNTDTLKTADNRSDVQEGNMTKLNNLTASLIDNLTPNTENQPIEESSVVATIEEIEEAPLIENDDYAVMMNIVGGQEVLGEELEKRIQRIKEEIEDLESIEERSVEDQKRYLELREQLQVFESVFQNKEN